MPFTVDAETETLRPWLRLHSFASLVLAKRTFLELILLRNVATSESQHSEWNAFSRIMCVCVCDCISSDLLFVVYTSASLSLFLPPSAFNIIFFIVHLFSVSRNKIPKVCIYVFFCIA